MKKMLQQVLTDTDCAYILINEKEEYLAVMVTACEKMDNSLEKEFHLYKDIQMRTGGEIYIGVVGPVRTGKSTFIKRFMDLLVLPDMTNEHEKMRAQDELPQSAAGTTVMTTEPKFVPNEAAQIQLAEGVDVKVRLIDCVGFMVDGASGHIEQDHERMVKTPWAEAEIPFTKAAEIGTRKVIEDHSTVGIVVTTDGSFTDIPRSSYVPAEEKTIQELSQIHKPFIVLLNSAYPYSEETKQLAESMQSKYNVTVLPVNCDQLKKDDILHIVEHILLEFPISQIQFVAPQWTEMLPEEHWLKQELIAKATKILEKYTYMKDAIRDTEHYEDDHIEQIAGSQVQMADGCVRMEITMRPNIYYDILSELTSTPIHNEYELIHTIRELSAKRCEFDKVKDALADVGVSGYGVVTPVKEEIRLEDPVVIRNGNKYGVKIKAQVPSINMLKTNISVEIAPIVGTKAQADDLIAYIRDNSREDDTGVWETNIFGKTIAQIVEDGIYEKTHNMTQESMEKISETLEKVMNENSGLVCLIV